MDWSGPRHYLRAMRSPMTVTVLLLLGAAPALAASDEALVSDARATVETFKKKDPKIEKFFSTASGYAVFPTIAKGGFIFGGAGGDGVLFVGGKPVGSVAPYVIIMFEMTILFGALTTILGILFNAAFAARRAGTIQYDERFSNDRFGIFVPVEAGKAAPIESLLKQSGAEEVHRG